MKLELTWGHGGVVEMMMFLIFRQLWIWITLLKYPVFHDFPQCAQVNGEILPSNRPQQFPFSFLLKQHSWSHWCYFTVVSRGWSARREESYLSSIWSHMWWGYSKESAAVCIVCELCCLLLLNWWLGYRCDIGRYLTYFSFKFFLGTVESFWICHVC